MEKKKLLALLGLFIIFLLFTQFNAVNFVYAQDGNEIFEYSDPVVVIEGGIERKSTITKYKTKGSCNKIRDAQGGKIGNYYITFGSTEKSTGYLYFYWDFDLSQHEGIQNRKWNIEFYFQVNSEHFRVHDIGVVIGILFYNRYNACLGGGYIDHDKKYCTSSDLANEIHYNPFIWDKGNFRTTDAYVDIWEKYSFGVGSYDIPDDTFSIARFFVLFQDKDSDEYNDLDVDGIKLSYIQRTFIPPPIPTPDEIITEQILANKIQTTILVTILITALYFGVIRKRKKGMKK